MAELRRLLIDSERIKTSRFNNNIINLTEEETHYLRKVLRLRKEDSVLIVNGLGNLWLGLLHNSNTIRISTDYDNPIKSEIRQKPLTSLAIVIPKRGFDDILRMSCEIGIDIIQPLISSRSTPGIKTKSTRWKNILKEAMEQSERLWLPSLFDTIRYNDWLQTIETTTNYAIARSRSEEIQEFSIWLNLLNQDLDEVWIAIGPEGGWSNQEELLAKEKGCNSVKLGDTILTTSTAGVVASQVMSSYRRLLNNNKYMSI